jgi:RNA-directed DNA polymerase
VSSATFHYLDLFAWRRVTRWLRKRHPGITWKHLFRRFLTGSPGHRPAEGKEVLFLAQQLPIVRYRWRATNIPTPWTSTRSAEAA